MYTPRRSYNDVLEAPQSASISELAMRAVVIDRYGGRDVLKLREMEKPKPKAEEILVRVRAAGVNPVDWKIRNGELWPILPRSFPHILGSEIAGEVSEIGDAAATFKPGDEVFAMIPGGRGGGYAEFAALPTSAVTFKPRTLSDQDAAAVPLAGLTALQALRDRGKLSAGQAVLINGASGGVGTFAVQIAKSLGAKVTAVCGTSSVELVSELGADEVIDYAHEDFTRGSQRYDLVFDAVGKRSFTACAKILTSRGRYVTTLPGRGTLLWTAVLPVAGLVGYGKRARIIMVRASGDDLKFLGHLVDDGKLRPVIDHVYPLDQCQEAHARSESGHAHGKIILRAA